MTPAARVVRQAAVRAVTDETAPLDLFEGRRLAAYEVPTGFFVAWLQGGGKLDASVLPLDARVYVVLTDGEQYPGLVQLIVESASFAPVVKGELPCFRIELTAPPVGVPGRKPS